jgi:hypothetical protein
MLVGIWLVALAVRLLAVWFLDAPASLPASAYEHGSIARYLVDGEGFVFHFYGTPGQRVPTSQQAPLMATLLAGSYLLCGTESLAAFWLALAVQCAAGAWGVVHLVRATHGMFDSKTIAGIAGVMASLGPAWVIASCHVQAVTWNLLAVAMMLDGAVTLSRRSHRSIGMVLLAGGNLLAWHVDPIVAAAGLVLIVYVARHAPFSDVACCCLVVALGVAPWTIRNTLVHGRMTFIKDSFWYVFWQGNTAASHGTDKLLPTEHAQGSSTRGLTSGRHSVDETMPEDLRARLPTLASEIERMDAFGQVIRSELARRPLQYFEKLALRLRQWLWFDETNLRSDSLVYRFSYVGLCGLAMAGWLTRPRSCPDGPIWILLGVMTLFAVLIITSARFRIPAEFLLIPWAAWGAGEWARRVHSPGQERSASPKGSVPVA